MVTFELKCVDPSSFGKTLDGDLTIDMSNRIIFPVAWLDYQMSRKHVFVNDQTKFIEDTRKSHMLLIYIIGHISKLKQFDVMLCNGTKGDYEVCCFTLPEGRDLEVTNKGKRGLPKIRKPRIAANGLQVDPSFGCTSYKFNQDMELYYLDHFIELSTYNENEVIEPDTSKLYKLAESCYKWVEADEGRFALQRKEKAKERAINRSNSTPRSKVPSWVVPDDFNDGTDGFY